jgi:hypothetical protein
MRVMLWLLFKLVHTCRWLLAKIKSQFSAPMARNYLFPEEPVQVEISSRQGVEPAVWWSEFNAIADGGTSQLDDSATAKAGVKQKIISWFKTKLLQLTSGKPYEAFLKCSPSMPLSKDLENDQTLGKFPVTWSDKQIMRMGSIDTSSSLRANVSIWKRASIIDQGPALRHKEPMTLSCSVRLRGQLNSWSNLPGTYTTSELEVNAESIGESEDEDSWEVRFNTSTVFSGYPAVTGIIFEFIVTSERDISGAQWQYLIHPRRSSLHLLEKAEKTGDITIVCKVGRSNQHS